MVLNRVAVKSSREPPISELYFLVIVATGAAKLFNVRKGTANQKKVDNHCPKVSNTFHVVLFWINLDHF